MSAQVYALQPFRNAKRLATQAGRDPQKAIAAVKDCQKRGDMGHHVAGKYRSLAMGYGPGPSGGAA